MKQHPCGNEKRPRVLKHSVDSEGPNEKRQCGGDSEGRQRALLDMKRRLEGLGEEEVVWQGDGASLCVRQLQCL